MPARRPYLATAVVASGDTLSSVIAMRGLEAIGIFAPVIDSAQAFMLVAPGLGPADPAAATFVRLRNHDFAINSEAVWNVGPGSAAAVFAAIAPFAFGKIGLSVAQTDTRTFTIVAETG
jgi:hypothetical protein